MISEVAPQIYIFHIYTRPKFTQIPNLHRTQIYTNPDLHGTHIYTAQIYTNPFPYIDSKKPKFTQPKFTQNPNLHNPTLHITQIYTKLFLQILLKLYKVNSIINPDKLKKKIPTFSRFFFGNVPNQDMQDFALLLLPAVHQ